MSLSDISEKLTNGFVGVATPFYSDAAFGVRYLLGTNIRPNKITSDICTYITPEFSRKNAKSIVKTGDLLTVQSGHIGTSAVVTGEFQGANCHALIITRLVQNQADPDFICQYLNSEIGEIRLKGLHVGSSVPHINTSELGAFKIPLPPLKEQKHIAEICRVYDISIGVLEKLLANSQRQKQSLMQQLLTGRRKFTSSQGQWRYFDFDEIFERITQKNGVGNNNVLTISAQHGLISQREFFRKSVASENLSGYTLLQRGDFAYNKSYSIGYPIGAIKPLLAYDAGVVSSLYVCFRLRPDVYADFDFFRHYFEAGLLNEEISGIAQEGARNHGLLNVSIGDFFKLRLYVPPAPVQRKIAEAINVAETEEKLLAQQLERLKTEKRALMQQLLTGKRRVPLPTPDPVSA